MKVDDIINNLLNNKDFLDAASLLSSKQWKELSVSNKVKTFNEMSKIVTHSFGIKKMYVKYFPITEKIDYIKDKRSNIYLDDNNICIRSFDYNQYNLLSDILYYVIRAFQQDLCSTSLAEKFDENYVKYTNKIYEKHKFGLIKAYNYEDDYIAYQFALIERKRIVEKIMFRIINNNYDGRSCFEEEKFMASNDVGFSQNVYHYGKKLLNESIVKRKKEISSIDSFKEKFNNCDFKNISSFEKEILYCYIYPDFYKNIDRDLVISVYDEIVARLYCDRISVKSFGKNVIVNGNSYSKTDFLNNPFNIVVNECLNDMDKVLRNDKKFLCSKAVQNKGITNAIIGYKKKWLQKVVEEVDSALIISNFGYIKYQPLSRLMNTENIDRLIEENTINNNPFKGRGV